jgi:predicted Rossmann fold nucleotide-binding protein DprA/Smf involved in DNA uptake
MLSPRTHATLLLTAHIPTDTLASPLDVREWNRLARWLASTNFAPESLVLEDARLVLVDWQDSRITIDRILALLDRGSSLERVLDRWLATGLWISGRSDDNYPAYLRKNLRESAPPLIYGYGDAALFNNRGVAIVGSRDAPDHDLQLAEGLGRAVSECGCNVISGGARGIDDRAARGAFAAGGTVIAVVADSLVRNAAKRQYRDHLRDGDLLLMTPYSPDAAFSAGNAMSRNRLIYCLSDAAIAVSSANGTGGTYGGASQNLKHGWSPLWVARTPDPTSGNAALVDQGASWLPDIADVDIPALFDGPVRAPVPPRAVQSVLL